MKNRLNHFALYTDDLERAKRFYAQVFNWGYNEYGPSEFVQIKDSDDEEGELIGALQSREYSPIEEAVRGMEGTIEVDDIDEIIAKVNGSGGRIVLGKAAIPEVGYLCKFLDTEGNLLCAMQYDPSAE